LWFVADLAVVARLPLFTLVDPERKRATGSIRRARRLVLRASRSVDDRVRGIELAESDACSS